MSTLGGLSTHDISVPTESRLLPPMVYASPFPLATHVEVTGKVSMTALCPSMVRGPTSTQNRWPTMATAPNDSALSASLGSTYLGSIAAAIFYGITSVQTYLYYTRYKDDSVTLRLLIFLLWLLGGLHQAFITHASYTYAVTDLGSPTDLLMPEWSVMAHVVVGSSSDAIVRGLFCQRVWMLSGRNWLITAAIGVSSLVVLVSSYAFAIKGLTLKDYFDLSEITWFLYTSFISSVVADVLIAASMCILLSRLRSGFAKTNSAIRVLMVYSVNTGVLTSMCAITCLMIYAAMPENRKFIFIAIYFVLPKLLLNAFLATLNARGSFRETVRDKTAGAFVSIPLSKPLGSHATTNDRPEYSQGHENQQIQIEVQTSRDMKVDPLNNIPGAREVHNAPHVNCDPELQ